MKAIVQDRFGPPDTLQLVDAEKPEIGSGEVLLKVHAAAVNPYDWHMVRGDPRIARLMGGVGLTKPKTRIAGVDVAGRVQDVGADVHGLRPGDEVFGFARGAFAEYATADAALDRPQTGRPVVRTGGGDADGSRHRPARDPGPWPRPTRAAGPGERRRRRGRHVRRPDRGRARRRGHRRVQRPEHRHGAVASAPPTWSTTRRKTSPTGQFDTTSSWTTSGTERIRDLRRAATPTGTVIVNGGGSPGRIIGAVGSILRAAIVNLFVRQRITMVPTTWSREDLLAVTELVDAGTLRPVIDRTYPLADTAAGLRHVEAGHARGKVVITVP